VFFIYFSSSLYSLSLNMEWGCGSAGRKNGRKGGKGICVKVSYLVDFERARGGEWSGMGDGG
jgi:hypothetical protein